MIEIIDNKCDFCGTCAGVCPVNCIDVKENDIIILVTTIPNITFKEVKKIKTQLEVLGKEFFGIIIVKD